jgi:hormone-sensitive lipase
MSSRSHQTYSRLWANNTGIPIFSIDYRKAPENPYPDGLDDCWQAYNWVINYASRFFSKLKKID